LRRHESCCKYGKGLRGPGSIAGNAVAAAGVKKEDEIRAEAGIQSSNNDIEVVNDADTDNNEEDVEDSDRRLSE